MFQKFVNVKTHTTTSYYKKVEVLYCLCICFSATFVKINYKLIFFNTDAINKTKMYEADFFQHLYIDLYAKNGKHFDSKYMKYFMHVPDSMDVNKKVSFNLSVLSLILQLLK